MGMYRSKLPLAMATNKMVKDGWDGITVAHLAIKKSLERKKKEKKRNDGNNQWGILIEK